MLAFLPTMIMNFYEMKTFFEWCFSVVVLSIGLADFGFSIYHRIHTDESGPGSIGYAAHIGGGAAGILVGINVLRNYIHKRWEGYLRLVCFLVWIIGLVICILVNCLAS